MKKGRSRLPDESYNQCRVFVMSGERLLQPSIVIRQTTLPNIKKYRKGYNGYRKICRNLTKIHFHWSTLSKTDFWKESRDY